MPRGIRYILFFSVCLVALSSSGFSQKLIYKSLTVEDGLPSSECYDVVQDSTGYIWIATDKGIAKFYGSGMKVFDESDGIKSSTVFRLFPQGNKIWFFTFNKYIQYIQNDSVYTPAFSKEVRSILDSLVASPNEFSVNEKGEILLTLYQSRLPHSYLEILPGKVVNILPIASELRNLTIISKEGHNTLGGVYTGKQVGRLDRVSVIHRSNGSVLDSFVVNSPKGNIVFSSVSQHYDGTNLIVGLQDTVRVIRDKKVQSKLPSRFLISGSLFRIDKGEFGYGREGKAMLTFRVNKGIITEHDTINQALTSTSGGMLDREGGLWLTSLQNGVHYVRNPGSRSYNGSIGETSIQNIVSNGEKLWIVTTNSQLFSIDSDLKTETRWPEKSDFLKTGKRQYGGVFGKVPGFDLFLKELFITNTHRVGDSLWFSGARTFGLEVNGKVAFNSFRDKGIINRYNSIVQKNGLVYLATLEGIEKYDPVTEKHYPNIEVNPNLTSRINDLELHEEYLLAATNGDGIFIIDQTDRVIQQINENDGLSSDFCNHLFKDKDGIFWVSTNKGVTRLALQTDKNNSIRFSAKVINKSLGLVSEEVSISCVKDGRLFAGTKRGLSYIPLGDLSSLRALPAPIIENVIQTGKGPTRVLAKNYKHNDNSLDIEFGVLSYADINKPKLEYRLSTLSTENSEWKLLESPRLELVDLSPGDYYLEVRIRKSSLDEESKVASYQFTILTPWWSTWSFRALIILLIVAITSSIYRWQYLQLKRKSELEVKTYQLRQSALNAQMNPHFIFNAMGSIQNLIIKQKLDEAEDYLTGLAKLLRLVLNRSSEDFSNLNTEKEILEGYVRLENLRFNGLIDLELNIHPSLDLNRIEIPAMLLQTLVENAILHGILPSGKKGRIEITIEATDTNSTLRISIVDNGIGMERSQELKKANSRTYAAKGIRLIQERLSTYSKLYKGRFSISFTDLKSQDLGLSGTRADLTVPVRRKS